MPESMKQDVKEFKSFYKTVGGSEGEHCYYPTRLDTYGCGCQHDCSYCYAKTLLEFRKLWNTESPSVADIEKVKRRVAKLEPGSVIRLGGMTDCFQPIERRHRVTYELIKLLNERRVHYLIVTKSDLVAAPEYLDIMDKELAHIQISVTTTDDALSLTYEKAPVPSKRIQAIETLAEQGFDVQLRLSPFIPEFIDFDRLNAVKCEKILVEFLRVNTWVERWFSERADLSPYTLKDGGYRHLPLEVKLAYLEKLTSFSEKSICEDHHEHYDYWTHHYNQKATDCCNLRFNGAEK